MNHSIGDESAFEQTEATLTSIYFQRNPQCSMRFYYQLEGDGEMSLNVGAKLWSSGSVVNLFESRLTALKMFAYKREVIDFASINESFSVVFTGRVKNVPTSNMRTYLALDDISFTSNCNIETSPPPTHATTPSTTSTTPHSGCGDGRFQCANDTKTCLLLSQVCDFISQCADNSDEKNCGIIFLIYASYIL